MILVRLDLPHPAQDRDQIQIIVELDIVNVAQLSKHDAFVQKTYVRSAN